MKYSVYGYLILSQFFSMVILVVVLLFSANDCTVHVMDNIIQFDDLVVSSIRQWINRFAVCQ